jgi:hypothetical protein
MMQPSIKRMPAGVKTPAMSSAVIGDIALASRYNKFLRPDCAATSAIFVSDPLGRRRNNDGNDQLRVVDQLGHGRQRFDPGVFGPRAARLTAVFVLGQNLDAVALQQLCPVKTHLAYTHDTNALETHGSLLDFICERKSRGQRRRTNRLLPTGLCHIAHRD